VAETRKKLCCISDTRRRVRRTARVSTTDAVTDRPRTPSAGERVSDTLRFARGELAEVGIAPGAENELAEFSAVVYSGQEVVRYFGRLVIDLDGYEVPRDKSPVLWMHYGDRIGYTTRLGVESGRLVAEGRLLTVGTGEHHELARQIVHDDGLGYPWELSIGVDYDLEEVAAGEIVQVNGQSYEGPIFVGRRARHRELSIVDLGADDSTFVDFFTRGGAGERALDRLADAVSRRRAQAGDDTAQHTQGARLMEVKDATAEDIMEINPEAADAIKQAGAEEARKQIAEEDDEGADGENPAGADGDAGKDAAANPSASMDLDPSGIDGLRSLDGADDGFVLDALRAKLSLDQARIMLAQRTADKRANQPATSRRDKPGKNPRHRACDPCPRDMKRNKAETEDPAHYREPVAANLY